MNKIAHQFAKYFLVAGAGYLVDFGTLVVLKEFLHIHYIISAAIGFALGLIVLYVLSSKFVFGTSRLTSKRNEFLIFSLIGVVGLGLLSLFMWLITGLLGINYMASKLLATVVVYLWNFFARRALYHN